MTIRCLALNGSNTMDVETRRRLWFDVWMWEATEAANASAQVTIASTDVLTAVEVPDGFAWWRLAGGSRPALPRGMV